MRCRLHLTRTLDLSGVRPGDVVALIGDFNPLSIATLLTLFDRRTIVVPLTDATRMQHGYFFDNAGVDVVVEQGVVRRIREEQLAHPLLDELRSCGHPGLVLFSSGTTGRPKAILHDFEKFLVRFRTPRPTLKTLNFLLFDHIGGINTLLHTLYNKGQVVVPSAREPEAVLVDIERHRIELLPTTPTFLRLMLLSDALGRHAVGSLKVITYGTERMDQPTLDRLCEEFPATDFRQTCGMSELGILRVKSEARNSLWMQVGGEGVETKICEHVLWIKSTFRMLGYLNAPSPFQDGWYETGDIVEQKGSFIRIVGRLNSSSMLAASR